MRGDLGQREALRRLAGYLAPLWKPLLLGLLFTMGYAAVSLGYGKLLKDFVDLAERQSDTRNLEMGRLYGYVGLAAGVLLTRAALYFGMNYTWAYATQKLSFRLRNEVYAHLQTLSSSFFQTRKTGQLLSTLGNDVAGTVSVLTTMQDSIQAPVVVVGGVVLLFVINWPLALIACLCLPLIAWVISRATRKMQAYGRQLQGFNALVTDAAQESLSNVSVVKAFGNEDFERARFEGRSRDIFRSAMRTVRLRLAMRQVSELLGALALMLVLVVGGWEIVHHPERLTFGSLAWFVLVLQQVTNAARDAGGISLGLTQVGTAADRVFTLLNLRSEIREKPEALDLPAGPGRVTFERVGFAYSSGIPVLADISFTMQPGQVVALVGPTGAGKTTIASLIPRLYDVTEGCVRVDGVDVRDCTLRSLRRQIGIVPQETILFAGTLRENILYGSLDATAEEVEEAARLANAWEFIERLPEGLETRIGERGVTLSGGQRQRIAIARALLCDPAVLLLDEATSALDAESEQAVQEALAKLVRQRTTLVIAHRLSTIRNADCILVLKEGRVAEMGHHEELLARGGMYADLYRTQFRGGEDPPRERFG